MKNDTKIKIFLVDDDALFLKSLEIEFLENADFTVETYSTGELCIANINNNPDVVILDYQLDGIVANA
ncbi:MAG: response regulator, partial [Bacteroidota bacterium]